MQETTTGQRTKPKFAPPERKVVDQHQCPQLPQQDPQHRPVKRGLEIVLQNLVMDIPEIPPLHVDDPVEKERAMARVVRVAREEKADPGAPWTASLVVTDETVDHL